MVNQAVDCRGRGQGILEDPLPVREDQVAGQQNRATLVAMGEQREENLHLVAILLYIPDVVDDQGLEPIQLLEFPLQS